MNRLKGAGTAGCCPCDQFVNCDCGPIACSVECQFKAATATVCGFPEYTSPSSPPKAYKSKAKTGTMYQGSFSVSGCASDPEIAMSGLIQWVFTSGGYNWTITITPKYVEKLGVHTWRLHLNLNRLTSPVKPPGGGFPFGCWYPNFGGTLFANSAWSMAGDGDEDVYIDLDDTQVYWQPFVIGQQGTNFVGNYTSPGNNGCNGFIGVTISGGAGAVNSMRDVWNYSSTYAPTSGGCGSPTVTDTSARYQEAYGPFPLTSGGTPSGSVADPDASLVSTTTTPTKITIDGSSNCLQVGGVWSKAQGETVEQLTSEDTEAAAIARADAGIGSWTPCLAGCIACASYKSVRGPGVFSLSYVHSQARANLSGMTPTHSYTVTFNFIMRLHGTVGAWTPQGTATAYITATLQTGTTDWVEVPQLNGYDVICSGCSAE